MITFYDSGYDYLQLKFLNESIDPQCEYFSIEPTKYCKNCEYRLPCRDMRRFIERVTLISAERKDIVKRKYKRHKK